MKHLQEWQLNDLADGLSAGDDAGDDAAHVAACAICREKLEAIRALSRALADLPRAFTPSRDLRPPVPVHWAAGGGRWLRAAAIVALAAGAAVVARVVVVQEDAAVARIEDDRPAPADATVPALPRIVAYTEAVQDLRTVIDRRTAAADDVVRDAVLRNLDAVDAAARELEEAVSRTPDDAALRTLLERSYRTRLEVMRSTVALLEH